ncbi:hypothetical protein HQ39_02680 [Porphyromonas sp. COT-108 OH2963]|uniref:dTDP-4-dehydrorhamnose reductase n=1 Tax=Porphyromonas sp. COT-108 OH2963 TaxID=1515614 RepID=UPI00052C38FC|nr:dTDP-4-dehydrorhamnose reductase [Porphyromonas sp. COT-108 OH2963]KGN96253.1 hypothetical protein HQ39_02680 [Porphyromonas sp. COT-108 OH2963]
MSRIKKKMRVWLTGAAGQLGNAIMRNYSPNDEIEWLPTTRDQIELSDRANVQRFFDLYKPDVILNAAAFTSVDAAENNPDELRRINYEVPKFLAELCHNKGKILMHISTDHVFGGGEPVSSPLKEEDPAAPCNAYGKSKHEGEIAVQESCPRSYVIRTSWLYSAYGNNFYTKIRRVALSQGELRLVTDEVGSPTSALNLAHVIIRILLRIKSKEGKIPFGLYHFADRGAVSRYDFARAILDLDPKTASLSMEKCLQKDYDTVAVRPLYSVLDTSKIEAILPDSVHDWKSSLEQVYNQE